MNRVKATATALATAVAATTVLATAIVPAMAATQTGAARPAAHAKAHAAVKAHAAAKRGAAGKTVTIPALRIPKAVVEIASELDHGKYVTIVKCSGGEDPPKPIRLAQHDFPLTVHGTGSSREVLAKLAKPNHYKTLYTCTVTVALESPVAKPKVKPKKKDPRPKKCFVCTRVVTLNTGFGGLAGQVAKHHPAK